MSEWLRLVYSSGSVQVAGIHLRVCLCVCAPVFCLEARPPDFLCASWCPDLEWALQWAWPQTQCVTEQNWEVPISYRNLYSNSITFSIWDDPEMIRLTFTRVFSMKNRFAEQIYRNNMFSLAAVIDLREASRVDSPSKYSFNVTLKCLCLLYTETWPYDFEKSYPTLSHRVSLLGVTVSSISECLGEVELSHPASKRDTCTLVFGYQTAEMGTSKQWAPKNPTWEKGGLTSSGPGHRREDSKILPQEEAPSHSLQGLPGDGGTYMLLAMASSFLYSCHIASGWKGARETVGAWFCQTKGNIFSFTNFCFLVSLK